MYVWNYRIKWCAKFSHRLTDFSVYRPKNYFVMNSQTSVQGSEFIVEHFVLFFLPIYWFRRWDPEEGNGISRDRRYLPNFAESASSRGIRLHGKLWMALKGSWLFFGDGNQHACLLCIISSFAWFSYNLLVLKRPKKSKNFKC